MQLTLSQCEDKSLWDLFVKKSPQGCIFCQTAFLDSLDTDYELWWVEEAGKPRLGATILVDENGEPRRESYPFSLYHGVLLDDRNAALPTHSRVNDAMQIVNFMLSEFEQRYKRILFCLHPHFEDLRAFSWFHYHEPHKGKFCTHLFYTGLIDIKSLVDLETYVASIRRLRKREYRRATAEGLTVETSEDIDTLAQLFWLTMERQRIKFDLSLDRLMRKIAHFALSQGYGELLICRNPRGDKLYATLVLYDERCGYHLIGNTHPDYRSLGSGTFTMIEIIKRCQARGLHWLDTCGINSPRRGDFKASFNARPVPYFVVNWERR